MADTSIVNIDTLVTIFFGAVITALVGMITWWFRRRVICAEIQAKHLDQIDKRTFRQSAAMAEMAHMQDDITNKYHPDARSNLGETVDRLLRDETGNL